MFHVKDINVFVFMPVMAWKQKKVIFETASFLAFLFSQMNIKNLKAWVRVSSEYFVLNWGSGKYSIFNRKALVSLFLWKGPTKKKSPENPAHVAEQSRLLRIGIKLCLVQVWKSLWDCLSSWPCMMAWI